MSVDSDKLARWKAAQRKEEDFWRREGVYEPQRRRVLERYRPVILEVAGELPDGPAILDIGCGPTCAGRLFPDGDKTFLDPLMDSYREVYGDSLPVDDELVCARAEEIPRLDDSFDLVMSVNSLDHMVDPEAVLREVTRVLRPTGIFLLGLFLHSRPIAAARKLIDRYLPFAREDAHPYHYTRRSARELLDRHFRVEREVCVFRRDDALVPAFHREDRMFVCRQRR